MKINVNGKVEDVDLVFGVADNKATDNTYEIVENCFTGSRDDDGNMIVEEEDFKLMKKVEEELKNNNEFSFELPRNWTLKTLYKKIVEANKEKTAMKNNRLANIIKADMNKNKVSKTAKAKYTQRQLKEMVANGTAIDITNKSANELYKLQKEEQLEPVGSSFGVYGANGRLYRGKSGKLYAVTARTTSLDALPW